MSLVRSCNSYFQYVSDTYQHFTWRHLIVILREVHFWCSIVQLHSTNLQPSLGLWNWNRGLCSLLCYSSVILIQFSDPISTFIWTLNFVFINRTECSSNKNKLFFPWMTNAMQSKSVALPCRRRINGQQSLREIQRWCKHTMWGSTGKKEWARWLVGPTWWQEWSIVCPAWEPAAACRRPGATPEIPYLGAHIRRSCVLVLVQIRDDV